MSARASRRRKSLDWFIAHPPVLQFTSRNPRAAGRSSPRAVCWVFFWNACSTYMARATSRGRSPEAPRFHHARESPAHPRRWRSFSASNPADRGLAGRVQADSQPCSSQRRGSSANRLQRITDKSDGLHGAVAKSELLRSFVRRTISSARVSASFIQRPLAGLFPAARSVRRRRPFAGWLASALRGCPASAGRSLPGS